MRRNFALHGSATTGWRAVRTLIGYSVFALICASVRGAPIDVDALLARPWLKLEMDGLVVVSDASEGQLRDWARQIRTFRHVLEVTCPIPSGGRETTATVFLFKSDGTLRPLLPLADGKPARKALAGFFGSRLGHDVGALSFGGSRLDARERLQHELTHWHLRKSPVPVPLWMQEGLAQIYETFVLDGGKIRLGQDRDYMRDYVRISGNPPLAGLFNTTELDYSRAGFKHQRTDLFYAQSWALLHYLLFASERGGLSGAPRYLMALKAGATPERALRDGFGVGIEEAHSRLEAHIRTPHWRFYEMPIARLEWPKETVVPLVGAELETRLAALLAVAGHRESVRQIVQRLLQRSPENAAAWELSAVAQMDRGDPDEATIAALTKALRYGTRNPYVPLALGYVSIERSLREETGRNTGELFALALEFRPGMPEAYEGVAQLVSTRHGETSPALKDLVADGLRGSPSSVELHLATAWIEKADGRLDAAAARLSKLLDEHPELPVEFRLQIQGLVAEFNRKSSLKSGATPTAETREHP